MKNRQRMNSLYEMKPSKLSFLSKLVIVVLVIALLVSHINFSFIAKALNEPNNDIIYDNSFTETKEFEKTELENEKTKNAKTYRYENGIIQTEIYNKAVHYLDNGVYTNIDNTLVDEGAFYSNNKNSYKVIFPKELRKDNEIVINYANHYLKVSYDEINSNAILDKDVNREVENLHDYIHYEINDNVLIRYDVLNESIKENIIINNYVENFSYDYYIETDLSLIVEEGKIAFYNNDELVYLIDREMMYDKDYNVSYDISLEVKEENDKYIISVKPSDDYLKNASYPVIIDPEIHLVDGGILDGIVTVYENDYYNNTSTFKSIGSFTINNRINTTASDDITASFNIFIPRIYNVNISDLITKNQLMYANLELTTVSTNAADDTNVILKYSSDEIDRVVFHNANVFNHKFNIIDAIGGELENFISNDLSFSLDLSLEGANNTYVNYSLGGDLTGDKPVIILGYLSEAGLSDYYTYEEFPMNNESKCYVAHNSGNLTYVYNDYSSNILLNLSHIYNTSRLGDSIYGSGFSINYNEYIVEAYNSFKLYLGNGKVVDYVSIGNDAFLSKEGTGDIITKKYNGSTLIGYERDDNNSIYVYNSSGKISTIYLNKADRTNNVWSSDAKKITIIYTNGVITRIDDSDNNYITLSYSTLVNYNPTQSQAGVSYLASAIVYRYDPTLNSSYAVANVQFEYDGGMLNSIENEYINVKNNTSSTKSTNIEYNDLNQMDKVYANSKGYTFSYDDRNRIEEVHVYNGTLTNGDYINFSYNKNGKETYVENSKEEITTYSFDNYYHTVKIENSDNYTTFYRYHDIYSDNTVKYNLNHKIETESNSFKNISNVIANHGFEVLTSGSSIYGWTKDVSGLSTATIETNSILFGSRVLKLYKDSGNAKVYQDIEVESGKEYIISCFIKNSNSGTGAYLDVVGIDGIVSYTSKTNNIKLSTDFNRYEYKFTASFTGKARIYLINESSEDAYFDNVSVSTDYIDTRYNYLDNSSFEKGLSSWSDYDASIVDNTMFGENCGDKSVRLTNTGFLRQTINKMGLAGDTFIFGGYAKYENYTGILTISLTYYYINGGSLTKTFTYQNPVEHSEYYMVKATAESDYSSIRLEIRSDSASSYAYVDNFSLYNENYGINVLYNDSGLIDTREDEINNQTTNYIYDVSNSNNLSQVIIDGDVTEYSYDNRKNITQVDHKNTSSLFSIDNDDNITSITTSGDNSNYSYYYGSTNYTSDGLYPYQTTDVLSSTTTYTYDYLTGLVDSIVDSNGRTKTYDYDDFGNITSFVEGKNNNTRTVTYTYNNDGLLSTITTGNTVYAFTYNSHNDLISISLNNNSIVSYNYDMSGEVYRGELLSEVHPYGTIYFEYYDNGLTKSISYGNTKVQEYVYNDYGEVSQIIDYKEGVTYSYNYDYLNRLINVNATNGNNITYTYDNDSRLVSRSNINGISNYTYSDVSIYQAFENKMLTQEDISSIYKINYGYSSDAFSNLDVISFYINNNYCYSKEFVRETKTIGNDTYYTGRISEINYNVGNDYITYEYTYDVYNNIIEITGITNNVQTYYEYNVYDCFNEIITQEIITNGLDIYSSYTYDARGNLLTFSSIDLNTFNTIHSGSFSYNNSNEITNYTLDGINYTPQYYNGLLRLYKSNSLYYDGKELVCIDTPSVYIAYSYNGEGIRKSKTVDGITTNYILNSNKIIRETTGNNVINYYYDSNDDVIGFTYNNQKYLYLKNIQNDVIGIIDSSGSLIVKYYYDAYGNILSITDSSGINLGSINPFRYRSYYYDNETGWYYLNSRYYDPFIRRFITPDDVSYLGTSESVDSYNLYSYCENNPVNNIDCGGHKKEAMTSRGTLTIGIIGLVVNLIKYGKNIFRIFKLSNASAIEGVLLTTIFILPIDLSVETIHYLVKNIASFIVVWAQSIFHELISIGLDIAKLSVAGAVVTIGCTIALMYLPKLLDSIKMIIYGIQGKYFYVEKKWYGFKYYDKK